MKLKLLFLLLVLGCCSVATFAQVTNAGLTGLIVDGEKKALPGVSIKAIHEPSGTVYATMTTESGNYVIQGMRTGGPYTIEISYIGTTPKKVNNVYLTLGENFILNENMTDSEESELREVVVSAGRNPIMNGDRTGAATNISTRILNRMPTVTRSLTDFTRLTPQANGNGFAGRDGRFNNLQIDGANFNNGFGLSSNPLPGGDNQPISLDAIEEIQVNIAPYDVRQGGFTGAGINAITRSGTNEFEGSAYAFFKPKSFTGLNVGESKLNENVRTSSNIYGARLGGAIVKNKLFFFANFEYENRNSAGNNWLARRSASDSGANITRVFASDLEAVRKHLIDKYGYDPGAYENYANTYNNNNIKGGLRLDWNINNKNKLTLRYNQMTGTSQQGANGSSGPNPRSSVNRISSESITFENGNYSFKNTVRSVTGELNSSFSSKASNQLLATFSHIRDTRSTPGSIFPFVDIWEGGKNYMSFGTELFSYNNDVINNNLIITDNFTYLAGKHTLTAGASFQLMNFANSYMRMGTSYYRYNSVASFLNDAKPDVYGTTYLYSGADNYARVNFGLGGVYIQDRYAVNNRLNITAGLRVDLPIYLNNPPNNPVVDTLALLDQKGNTTNYTTAKWPNSTPLFSPRIGFNYDVNGDRSVQLRGGTGIFTGNIPFVWFTNMPTNAGVSQNTFEPVDSATLSQITGLNADPNYWVNQLPSRFPNKPGTRAPGTVNFIDPKFKMPQVWRSNIGVDYKIGNSPVVVTADVIYTKDINAIYQFNANRKQATGNMNYSGDDRDLWNGANSARFNAATGAITPVLSNTNKGYSFAATVGANLTNFKGLSGSLFYTYSAARDISGNPGSAANSAWSNNYSINDPNEQLLGFSQYAIPHRIVGSVSYRVEYANHLASTFSLFYNGSHQGRFAWTYGGDINRDGVSLDLLYLPANSSDLIFEPITVTQGGATSTLFSANDQRRAYDAIVNNYLSDSKGGYVDRNSGLLPWLNRWDFKFIQDVFVDTKKSGRRHSLQVSLDVMNVSNLINKNWGVYQELNGGSSFNYSLLNVRSVSDEGVPTFRMITITEGGKQVLPTTPFRNLNNVSSTWGMQLGVRYTF